MIFHLIYKDLLRRSKKPLGLIVLTLLPLIFTLLMGLIFAPGGNDAAMPRINLLIEDHDDSFASRFIINAFSNQELADLFEVQILTDSSGHHRMNNGEASALLTIPPAFGDSLLNQSPAELNLIKNPAQSFGPKIAEETVEILTEAGNRFLRLAESPMRHIRRAEEREGNISDAEIALIAIQMYRLIRNFENYIFPPKIELNTLTETETESSGFDMASLFALILSGITVMCLLFAMEVLARDMFDEQDNHTLYRMRVSPAPLLTLIMAKLLFFVLIGFLSNTLVWLTGNLLFGISMNLNQWLKMLVFSIILLASLSSVINLLYSLIRSRNQAQSISPAVIIFFSMLGGSMIPAETLPAFIRKIAVISPVYWGVEGLKNIVLDAAGWQELMPGMAVLGLIALIMTGLSIIFYNRKYQL